MLEFDDFPYHKDRIPKGEGKKEEFFKKLEEEFRREIIASPEAKAYLENFRAEDVDRFIEKYADTKTMLAQNYDSYNYAYREAEEYEYKFQKKAQSALHVIRQKKLFNTQLKWRAGQLHFESNLDDLSAPGLDVCIEFNYWEGNIASCPYIEPVTEFEKDIMKEYLLTEAGSDIIEGRMYDWQNYDFLTEKDKRGHYINMPRWYEFYDLHAGTGSLLLLPDLKREKEIFYMHLAREDEEKKAPAASPPAEEADNRPKLFAYGKDVINFAGAIEKDKYFKQLFRGYQARCRKEDRPREVDEMKIRLAIDELCKADRKITFPTHLNWDEAIMYAFMKYQNIKTAEALDMVYDEYLMRLELGMTATEQAEDDIFGKPYLKLAAHIKEVVLQGRVKNGEPADFNY